MKSWVKFRFTFEFESMIIKDD